MLRKIFDKLLHPHTYNNAVWIKYLQEQGVDIASNCIFFYPNDVFIDIQRPHMLHIGNHVKITKNVTILAHDYSRSVLIMYAHKNIGEAKQTWIGDNVFIGMNATILMGTHIGNNSIVGAGSVVHGHFEDGVVIAGNPAKVICTIDQYKEKREQKTLEDAVEYANLFKERYKKYPTVEQMTNAFSWLYLPRTEETIKKYPGLFKLSGIDLEQYKIDFYNSQPKFSSYEKFIDYVNSLDEMRGGVIFNHILVFCGLFVPIFNKSGYKRNLIFAYI